MLIKYFKDGQPIGYEYTRSFETLAQDLQKGEYEKHIKYPMLYIDEDPAFFLDIDLDDQTYFLSVYNGEDTETAPLNELKPYVLKRLQADEDVNNVLINRTNDGIFHLTFDPLDQEIEVHYSSADPSKVLKTLVRKIALNEITGDAINKVVAELDAMERMVLIKRAMTLSGDYSGRLLTAMNFGHFGYNVDLIIKKGRKTFYSMFENL